jgi:hypothetical protein
VVVKGLLYLLFTGIAVFLGALLMAALRMRRQAAARPGESRPGCTPETPGGRTVPTDLVLVRVPERPSSD